MRQQVEALLGECLRLLRESEEVFSPSVASRETVLEAARTLVSDIQWELDHGPLDADSAIDDLRLVRDGLREMLTPRFRLDDEPSRYA